MLFVSSAALAITGGAIPPSKFVFRNIVPYQPPEGGGWKAACVHITFVKPAIPQKWICPVQVGVPEVNATGTVTDALAQTTAAAATDSAAHALLDIPGPVIPGTFCINLYRMIEERMRGPIPGTRITACREARAWATHFP